MKEIIKDLMLYITLGGIATAGYVFYAYIELEADKLHCQKPQQTCELRCAEDNLVGSTGYLKCNNRCREDYHHCVREGR